MNARAVDLGPGDVVAGRYVIRAPLGRGGFGTVYRATHRDLGDDVAIKVLRHELAADRTARERFLSEVRLTQAIVHKNAVRLREFGHDASLGCLYFTMDLIEGETLAALLARERTLTEERAVAIVSQVLAVLGEAHASGLVHRDVKPANIMVTPVGGREEVRVLDFGIAKAILPQRTRRLTLTLDGAIVGTPGYMSPEHLLGRKLDGRSDLYSVGVVLYQALSGRLPHEADPSAEDLGRSLVARVLTHAPRELAKVAPGVSPGLRAVVMRALEREPRARFEDARTFRDALESALAERRTGVDSLKTGAFALPPRPVSPTRESSSPTITLVTERARGSKVALALAASIVLVATTAGATAFIAHEGARTGLVIRTHPEGARVEIDGKIDLGKAPASIARIAPGEHEVTATLAGRSVEKTHVRVVEGERTELVLELAPEPSPRPSAIVASRPTPAPSPRARPRVLPTRRPPAPPQRPPRDHVDPFEEDE